LLTGQARGRALGELATRVVREQAGEDRAAAECDAICERVLAGTGVGALRL
jgi:hypothetical protein